MINTNTCTYLLNKNILPLIIGLPIRPLAQAFLSKQLKHLLLWSISTTSTCYNRCKNSTCLCFKIKCGIVWFCICQYMRSDVNVMWSHVTAWITSCLESSGGRERLISLFARSAPTRRPEEPECSWSRIRFHVYSHMNLMQCQNPESHYNHTKFENKKHEIFHDQVGICDFCHKINKKLCCYDLLWSNAIAL